jgi:tRNA dimethylallyltransferase
LTESQQKTGHTGILIVIAGPTASGKSDLAFQLAKKYNADIFSADSRQVYSEMNIGTAKPDPAELNVVKHYFINHISIQEPYSAGRYETEILNLLNEYFKHKPIAILCGGTGLYIKAATEGLDVFPEIPREIQQQLTEKLEKEGIGSLQKALLESDPEYYSKVDLNNPMRLIRALSVIHVTGKPYSSFLTQTSDSKRSFLPVSVLLDVPRKELYARIDQRVDKMVDSGLEAEALSLFPHRDLRALNTVGYSEWFDYFEGKTDRNTAIELIKRNSRRYAKRQITWFGKYGVWNRFHPDDISIISTYIDKTIQSDFALK